MATWWRYSTGVILSFAHVALHFRLGVHSGCWLCWGWEFGVEPGCCQRAESAWLCWGWEYRFEPGCGKRAGSGFGNCRLEHADAWITHTYWQVEATCWRAAPRVEYQASFQIALAASGWKFDGVALVGLLRCPLLCCSISHHQYAQGCVGSGTHQLALKKQR